MTDPDIVQICGYLVAAWSLGFCAGYILTRFRDAVNMIV